MKGLRIIFCSILMATGTAHAYDLPAAGDYVTVYHVSFEGDVSMGMMCIETLLCAVKQEGPGLQVEVYGEIHADIGEIAFGFNGCKDTVALKPGASTTACGLKISVSEGQRIVGSARPVVAG